MHAMKIRQSHCFLPFNVQSFVTNISKALPVLGELRGESSVEGELVRVCEGVNVLSVLPRLPTDVVSHLVAQRRVVAVKHAKGKVLRFFFCSFTSTSVWCCNLSSS